MKLFNALTNKKEEFIPKKDGEISLYFCGPTVYNHAHIGNIRPMIIFDVITRLFEYKGLKVTSVSNYTDVDDKIVKAAKEEGIDEATLSKRYIKAYEDVRASLHVKEPTFTPKVSESIDSIISFIKVLIEKGFAYQEEGDVYFSVDKIADYGSISKIKVEDLLAGASERVGENDKKHSPLDFVLWKETQVGIRWDSPWSKGRPGWHTECVVMINDIFGEDVIDIHGGGHDLKFPHHENEVAQSMAFHNHHLANFWVHNNLLNINNQKMSKSLGNVMWAKDIIAMLGGNVVRWLMLSTHYRNPLNYTNEIIETVNKEVNKVENALKQTAVVLQLEDIDVTTGKVNKESVDTMVKALEDDLNTSLALTSILNHVKTVNQLLRAKEKDFTKINNAFSTLLFMTSILGFDFNYPLLSNEDKKIYTSWISLKKEKRFIEADVLRLTLQERGII